MPRFDGTGPLGFGPMTGRGFGPCGYGRGYGRRYYTKKEEGELIEDEIKEMEEELRALKERLSEIRGK